MTALRSILVENLVWRLVHAAFNFRPRRPYQEPQAIAILKPCCVGDVLLATPVSAELRRVYPQARLTWVVHPWARPMLDHNPRLDEVLEQPSTRLVPNLVRILCQGRFDTCFILDRSPLLTLAAWHAGVPQRIGLDSAGRGFAHTVRVPVGGIRHEAETYLDTLRAVNIPVGSPHCEFYPATEDRQAIDERFQAGQIDVTRPIIVIHPAGGENPGMKLTLKRWPQERFAALIPRLARDRQVQFILVGGPADHPITQAVQELTPYPTLNLGGQLSWGQLGALCSRAALYVGNDTGATHLAVAAGCPVLAIFGPTDPRRYGPYAPPGRATALWHPTRVPSGGVAGGIAADFSWDHGVTVDEAAEAAMRLLG